MRERIRDLNKRTGAEIGQVERRRGVVHNQAVIAGTRIPVSAIKAYSEAGYTTEQIIEEYPTLSAEDVEAAIKFGDERSAA
jgi:uncharacterized protein (DUF433 family)